MAGLGDPVSGDNFINRAAELALLTRRLDSFVIESQKRNIAIIGLRKIGKSSLIQEFLRSQKRDDCILATIYLPEGDQEAFILKSIGAVLVSAMRKDKYQVEPTTTFEQLLDTLNKQYPKTVNFVNQLFRRSDHGRLASLKDVLIFLSVFQTEINLPLVIIFDEFQRILGYNFPTPIDEFREFIMNTNKIWFIISGSCVGMLTEIVSSSESPLFGHFEQLFITEFDFINARELLDRRLAPFSIGDLEKAFIFELSNGNPHYLDLIAFRIKDKAREQNVQTISEEIIIDALVFELFSAGGAIYSHLSSFIENSLEKRGFGSYIEILKTIAIGSKRPSEISSNTGIPLTSLPRYIKKLIELDIIRKIGSENGGYPSYCFIDPILDLWLKEVFILREDNFIADLGAKKKAFQSQISRVLAEYKSEIGKGNEARVRELFGLLDGRDKLHGTLLPKFDLISSYDNGRDEIEIVAESKGIKWACDISDSNISISDIKEFIEKLERLKLANTNKIFIALSGIQTKTIEFCKQYSILLLNREDINMLMKKYRKKRILL